MTIDTREMTRGSGAREAEEEVDRGTVCQEAEIEKYWKEEEKEEEEEIHVEKNHLRLRPLRF